MRLRRASREAAPHRFGGHEPPGASWPPGEATFHRIGGPRPRDIVPGTRTPAPPALSQGLGRLPSMTATGIDRAIEALARRQHGAFSTSQAYDLGATPRIIERRRSNGQWAQLSRTVWALPSAPPTWHRQVMAGVLSLPGSSVSGLAAGHLLELDGYRPVRPELTVPRGGSRRSPFATVHQSDRAVTTTCAGFPVVTVEQAICDSAGRLGAERVEAVIEAAVVGGRTSPGAILARAAGLIPNPPRGGSGTSSPPRRR
jgi:hypothetical protein